MEHLLYATGVAVLELAQFADSKVKDGTMDKNRLIMPGWRRMKKWIRSCFNEEDGQANSQNPDHSESGTCTVYIGDPESAFGLRVAMATMTIGIVNFLEPTQTFFVRQRLVWAMIIIGERRLLLLRSCH